MNYSNFLKDPDLIDTPVFRTPQCKPMKIKECFGVKRIGAPPHLQDYVDERFQSWSQGQAAQWHMEVVNGSPSILQMLMDYAPIVPSSRRPHESRRED